MNRNMINNKILGMVIFYLIIIVGWQFIYIVGTQWMAWWKPYAFPNPKGVIESFFELCKSKTLGIALGYSLARALIGFLIAIVIGTSVGLMLVKSSRINYYLKPILLGIQTLPSICWVPFAILWFGLKEQAIIFVIIMGSAFSVAMAVENGIKNINPILVKAARTMGANGRVLYLKVIFPASLPAFVAGLRQGWSFAWRALMSGEVMSSSIGLGYTLMMGRDLADINQVTLIMIIIILVGVVIDKIVFSKIETRMRFVRGL